ncbi:hypothetical protein LGMK_02650 [Leuconostoc sp. C2]|uniref:Uncharacterized protein n=1 Tax=Leuconostoc kimchii (strain IMSNU 11154 / KCTC 2386 / IH25) TaxID=762051 RepID=D5T4G1_LEUKI|nr:hypothetical protein LKI_09465 [Leuconostoc kimchii IMSNU 11154]AEJ30588.1 hypothetical protein LGMK_02650 [Leuconostoc sp. C2]
MININGNFDHVVLTKSSFAALVISFWYNFTKDFYDEN